MSASPDIPATSEVLLKSDASKQFLDTLLGQGWDAWGQGLGGSQAAELMDWPCRRRTQGNLSATRLPLSGNGEALGAGADCGGARPESPGPWSSLC